MRARTADAILLMTLWTVTGCDAFAELRAFFHDDGSPPGSADAKASLRVDVEPTQGISILLDGVRVGRSSPLHKTDIEPGHHSLEVRAMGYHPVLLPIALKPNHVLRLPVSLRPRHVRQALPRPRPPREAWVDPEAPPPPPSPPAPPLPAGVDVVRLHVAPRPHVPVLLDGRPIQGRTVTLERISGKLQGGGVALSYRVGGAGVLELILPDDDATWQRDGTPMEPGDRFRLHRGATRIRRYPPAGADPQTLILRRL